MVEKTKAKKPSKGKAKTTAKNDGMHPLAYEIIGILLIAFAIIEFFQYW